MTEVVWHLKSWPDKAATYCSIAGFHAFSLLVTTATTPRLLFFSVFFAEAHNSRWIVDNWNHDHSPSLRFSVFFLPEVRHCSGWASHDPSFHSFFCVYCWGFFLAEAHHSGCLGDSLGDAWHDLVRFSNSLGCELGNLTRHDLPSHNNTNLNHPVTTSHFPNSQNFPNLQKYKDKKVQKYKNTFHSVATNKPELL